MLTRTFYYGLKMEGEEWDLAWEEIFKDMNVWKGKEKPKSLTVTGAGFTYLVDFFRYKGYTDIVDWDKRYFETKENE